MQAVVAGAVMQVTAEWAEAGGVHGHRLLRGLRLGQKLAFVASTAHSHRAGPSFLQAGQPQCGLDRTPAAVPRRLAFSGGGSAATT
jgi:hypothetical protein